MKRLIPALALSAVLGLAAVPASATSYIMVSDEDLAAQADAVVVARMLTVEDAPGDGMPSTDYLVEIERLLKGDVPGSNLIVRVPGGFHADGSGRMIWGAPAFSVDERPLLFLRARADGTWGVLHLMLGAFHEVSVGGRALWVRDLGEAVELTAPSEAEGSRARYHRPRDRTGFVDWIAERGRGIEEPGDYFAAPQEGLAPVIEGYSWFLRNNRRMRWFEFDGGGSVPWRVMSSGQPGLTLQQTINAFRAGQAAWNDDPATNVRYTYAGTTAGGLGLTSSDGVNTILFDNPNSNEGFDSPFSCSQGGVLALGGPFVDPGVTGVFNGETFFRIGEADIETNDNIGCFFQQSSNGLKAAEELFGHELGHTLGLGHSCDGAGLPCDQGALMWDFIHDNGRGARLTDDDRAGLAGLYRDGDVPAAPSNLVATVLAPTQVRLTWSDNSGDETAFKVERKTGSGQFQQILQLPANTTTVVVAGLTAQTTYSFIVRATNAIGDSPYSNVATVATVELPPAAPSNLLAFPQSTSSVQLVWTDNSTNETGFVVERSSPLADLQQVAVVPAGTNTLVMSNLAPGRPYTFRVRARNALGDSAPSNEASATPFDGESGPCVADDATLCLLASRFRVRVHWRNQYLSGDNGIGHAAAFPGSQKSGTFWFFNPANVELIVKALDGQPVNGFYWLFYGALSDVEYWITVVDTETEASRTYHNPPGELCGFPDNAAFPGTLPASTAAVVLAPEAVSRPSRPSAASHTGSCLAGPETLCLQGGRFEVTVDWVDHRSLDSGTGKAIPGTDKSGYFWFFNDQNVELVTKVLPAPMGEGFWFFYGALSDVNYTITVRDTETDLVKFYVNDPGDFCGQADTEGFPATLP